MTNEEKLKANMAAARLIGYASPHHDGESVFVHATNAEKDDSGLCLFDIFSNPTDQLAVVHELCERCITIRKQARNDYRIVRYTSMSRKGRRSYAEAVAAALLEVA